MHEREGEWSSADVLQNSHIFRRVLLDPALHLQPEHVHEIVQKKWSIFVLPSLTLLTP